MPPRKQIALQPALAEMLAQHLHYTAIGREVIIDGNDLLLERTVLGLKHISQAVRVGLVGTEEAEILLARVALKDVPQEPAKLARVLKTLGRGLLDLQSIIGEVRD